jgi:hypothetical protein
MHRNKLTYQPPKKRKENKKDMHIHSESSSKHVLCVFWQLHAEGIFTLGCSDMFGFAA